MAEEWKQDCLENYKSLLAAQSEETLMVSFIDNQVTQHVASGAKQRRWSENWIRFWLAFRHQPSGRACIEFLTGADNYGKKTDNNSNTNFNLHIPSNRLLDMYEKPGYYPVPKPDEIQQLLARATTYAAQSNSPFFIFFLLTVYLLSLPTNMMCMTK